MNIRRTISLLLAVLFFSATHVCSQTALPPGQLMPDGTFKFGSIVVGKYNNGKLTLTPDGVQFSGIGSDLSKQNVVPNAFGALNSLERTLGRIGSNFTNLWFNPDGHLGNGAEQILPNHALVVYGPKRWNFQQATLTPFQTIGRAKMDEGDDAIYWLNGIKGTGSNTFGTGTKTLTVPAGVNFVDTFPLEMVNADDITKKMFGTVVSYSGTTLTLNITSVAPGSTGTFTNWVVGKNGNSTEPPVVLITSAPTAPGSDVLNFSDTSAIRVGMAIEYYFDAQFNSLSGIQLGAYVVSKTATTVRMSKPAVQPTGAPPGVAVVAPQSIRFYNDQGHFGYQDLFLEDAKGLMNGTSLARDSYLSFDIISNVPGNKLASIMFSGYKADPPFIGRSFVQSFPMPTTRTHQIIKIPGDKAILTDGSWKGYMNLYGALGFVYGSTGTVTSQNIPDGVWITSPPLYQGVGGSDKQTFQLGDIVGAWVKVTAVKWEMGAPTPYDPPTTLLGQYPTPEININKSDNPCLKFNSFGNTLNLKKWWACVVPDGRLTFRYVYDAEDGAPDVVIMNRDGSLSLPAYPDGTLSIAGSKIGSTPIKQAKEPLVPVNGRLAWFGDSISAMGDAKYGTAISNAGYGMTTWAKTLNSSRLYVPPGGNFGISGDTLQNMVTRLQPVIDARPAVVSVLAGTNSIGTASDGQLIRLLHNIYSAFLSNGMRIIAIPILPRYDAGWTAENERQRLAINTWIRTQAGPRLTLLDLEGRIPSSMLADGVHPGNQSNAFAVGSYVADILGALTAGDPVNMLDGVQSTYTPNPRMSGTGGGMNGSPTPTGQVSDGWVLTTAGGATITASKIFDEFGNPGQRLVVSGTYTGSNLDIGMAVSGDSSTGLPASGDVIEGMLDFTISGNPVGIGAIQFTSTVYTSGYASILGSISTWVPITRSDPVPAGLSGKRVVMRSPALQVTGGTPAVLPQRIAISLLDAPTARPISLTLDIWGAASRKVPGNF